MQGGAEVGLKCDASGPVRRGALGELENNWSLAAKAPKWTEMGALRYGRLSIGCFAVAPDLMGARALEPPPPLRARRARGARHFHGTEIIIL